MNTFQQALCPEYPEINEPVRATIKPGGEFSIKDAGLFNDIQVQCKPSEPTEPTEPVATVEEFLVLNGEFRNFIFLLMFIGLVYYVINDNNPF